MGSLADALAHGAGVARFNCFGLLLRKTYQPRSRVTRRWHEFLSYMAIVGRGDSWWPAWKCTTRPRAWTISPGR